MAPSRSSGSAPPRALRRIALLSVAGCLAAACALAGCSAEPSTIDLLGGPSGASGDASTGGKGAATGRGLGGATERDGQVGSTGGPRASDVHCTSNASCGGRTPYCDVDDRRCVECTSAAQCAPGEVCAAEVHACTPACSGPGDCAGSGRTICSTAARVCVQCTAEVDCSGAAPHCYLRTGSCVQCLTDTDCASKHCRTDTRECEG